MPMCAVALWICFTGTERLGPVRLDSAPQHKARSMEIRFAKFALEAHTDCSPFKHFSVELKCQVHTRLPHSISMPNLANTLVPEWATPASVLRFSL